MVRSEDDDGGAPAAGGDGDRLLSTIQLTEAAGQAAVGAARCLSTLAVATDPGPGDAILHRQQLIDALNAYLRAAQLLWLTGSGPQCSRMQSDAAALAAYGREYTLAAVLFELLARSEECNRFTVSSPLFYCFAVLAWACRHGIGTAQELCAQYQTSVPDFHDSHPGEVVQRLLQALDSRNEAEFQAALNTMRDREGALQLPHFARCLVFDLAEARFRGAAGGSQVRREREERE